MIIFELKDSSEAYNASTPVSLSRISLAVIVLLLEATFSKFFGSEEILYLLTGTSWNIIADDFLDIV
jgi:hypothetical protein